jgi:hypothetical protein
MVQPLQTYGLSLPGPFEHHEPYLMHLTQLIGGCFMSGPCMSPPSHHLTAIFMHSPQLQKWKLLTIINPIHDYFCCLHLLPASAYFCCLLPLPTSAASSLLPQYSCPAGELNPNSHKQQIDEAPERIISSPSLNSALHAARMTVYRCDYVSWSSSHLFRTAQCQERRE